MSDLATDLPRIPYRRAALVLMVERLAPVLWPGLAIPGLFLVLALSDVLPVLPGWAHGLILLGLAAAWGVMLWRALQHVRRPDRGAARRRIERASGLAHRPLSAIEDRPVGGDAAALGLWQAYRGRVLAGLPRLRVGAPESDVALRDPWALRGALALALFAVWLGARDAAPARIARALSPEIGGPPAPPPNLDVWITPPAYTRLPPMLLAKPGADHGTDKPIAVPIGSKLLARVGGAKQPPMLDIDTRKLPFDPVEGTDFRVETMVDQGSRIALSVGGTRLAEWPIDIVPDLPPAIRFGRAPSLTQRGSLRIDYRGADDYGFAKAEIRIARTDPEGAKLPPLALPLSVAENRPSVRGAAFFDLLAHPWAGLPAELTLVGRDAIGQEGMSKPVKLVLPERQFRHPVARAIVAERKRLALDPTNWASVAQNLFVLNRRPELFQDDTVVFLGLAVAANSLARGQGEIDPKLVDLLWDLAVRLDTGMLGRDEQALRAAQDALKEAMAKDAPQSEIDRLTDQLREALDRYLQSLAEQALRNPPAQQNRPIDPNARAVTRNDLQRMLDQARELDRQGRREEAQALLDRLREMLENMQIAPMTAEGNQAGEQAMRELQDLARRQRDLMDQGLRAEQRQDGRPSSEDGDQQGEGAQGLADQQQALGRALGQLRQKLQDLGAGSLGGLDQAERSMRQGEGALRRNAPGEALGPQGDALKQLQQAQRELGERMQGEARGDRGRAGNRPGRPDTDPFGRPRDGTGGVGSEDVAIPDDNQIERARQIYEELQRRAADPARPSLELDYLRRLLERF